MIKHKTISPTVEPQFDRTPHPRMDSSSLPTLEDGEIRLFSFFAPSIPADQTYKITVTQSVTPNTIIVPDFLPQEFTIFAPRVKLEKGDIHSVFPPPHHAAIGNILPHIIFNDPHIPWEREAFPTTLKETRIPWLAVIPFELEELRLTDEQLAVGGLFKQTGVMHQSATMTLRMTAGDAAAAADPAVKLPFPRPPDSKNGGIAVDTMLDMIFVDPHLAYALLGAERTKDTAFKKTPDLDKYSYFSHVRQVDDSLYSVLFSHRTGPCNIDKPKPIVVHLVALDGLGDIELMDPDSGDAKLPGNKVGFISLHSWTYTCNPPQGPDIGAAMSNLGAQAQQMFCLPKVEACPPNTTSEIHTAMNDRLEAGYTLVRHRLPTGELTVAFYRSPLTPVPVAQINPPDWPTQSNFGTDYQILDRVTGVMDISYSVAFQLGKALALADAAFHTCLARVRVTLYEAAHRSAENAVYKANDRYWDIRDVVGADAMNQMYYCHRQLRDGPADGSLKWPRRWVKGRLDDDTPKEALRDNVKAMYAGSHLSSAAETLGDLSDLPYSTDFEYIVTWLQNSLTLSTIPFHYLIPDPSMLPQESIRHFHIDPIWFDCFIDGALSLANHLDGNDDRIRQAIKTAFNKFLATQTDPKSKSPDVLFPQVARAGFFIRSKVIEAFPDIRLTAEWPPHVKHPASAQSEVDIRDVDKGLVYCLLDRLPEDSALASITITQPPHQQCFSIGVSSDSGSLILDLEIKKMPKPNPDSGKWESFEPLHWTQKNLATPQIYDWDTRVILVKSLRDVMEAQLKTLLGYGDQWQLTSAVMGLQLNDDIHELRIVNQKAAKADENWAQTIRKLVVSNEVNANPPLKLPHTDRGREYLIHSTYQVIWRQCISREYRLTCDVRSVDTPLGKAPPKNNDRLLAFLPNAPHLRLHSGTPAFFQREIKNLPSAAAQFSTKVYPRKIYVSANTNFLSDIIFSIQRTSLKDPPPLWLTALCVTIPVGPDATTSFTKAYQGRGAKMLSNQRFHTFITNAKDKDKPGEMVITLLPRVKGAGVLLDKILQLSFQLMDVEVGQAEKVHIKLMERYSDKEHDGTISECTTSVEIAVKPM